MDRKKLTGNVEGENHILTLAGGRNIGKPKKRSTHAKENRVGIAKDELSRN